MNLEDKIVVITGGSKGLGKAMALSFLKNGAKVAVCSRDEKRPEDLEENIFWVKADVTKEEELKKLADFVVEKFGRLDIWINNAGILLPRTIAEDFDMEQVRKMFDVNVFGVINGSRVALRFIKKQGFGSIINIISDSAFVARPMSSMYAASKWAVNGFTKSIREANKNIKIIAEFSPLHLNMLGDSSIDYLNEIKNAGFNILDIDDKSEKLEKKDFEQLMRENNIKNERFTDLFLKR